MAGRPLKSQRDPFGFALLNARLQAGLKQQNVADALGLPVKTVSTWEVRGRIRTDYLIRLAKLYGKTVEELRGTAPEIMAKLDPRWRELDQDAQQAAVVAFNNAVEMAVNLKAKLQKQKRR